MTRLSDKQAPEVREDPKSRYCAEVCSAAGEPLAGTAIRVDVWIMLEYRRAWAAKALEENQLEDRTQHWLRNTVAAFADKGLIARPQFIRRPEHGSTRRLFVAQQGELHETEISGEAELHDLDLTTAELPTVAKPNYFVCTNAKRDVCCVKFGRPTYAALHKAVGGRAWQTTHVGGHRYAPNVLVLPQSALYGRVFPADIPQFVKTIEAGELARDFLRGRSTYSEIAQVAEQAIPDAINLLGESATGATFATATGQTTVTVAPAAEAIEIIPSCGKPAQLTTPWQVQDHTVSD